SPLPADLAAHCQQVATLQGAGVFSECGIHSSLLGGKAPQFEHLLQHRVIELNVRFHIAPVYMQSTARGTWLYMFYVHRLSIPWALSPRDVSAASLGRAASPTFNHHRAYPWRFGKIRIPDSSPPRPPRGLPRRTRGSLRRPTWRP